MQLCVLESKGVFIWKLTLFRKIWKTALFEKITDFYLVTESFFRLIWYQMFCRGHFGRRDFWLAGLLVYGVNLGWACRAVCAKHLLSAQHTVPPFWGGAPQFRPPSPIFILFCSLQVYFSIFSHFFTTKPATARTSFAPLPTFIPFHYIQLLAIFSG